MVSKDEKALDRVVEDAPFEVPPFNEKEFIRKELISFKSTLILFGFSIVVAVITFFFWRDWTPQQQKAFFFPMAVVVVGVGLVAVRFLFKALRIDMSHWKRKEWFGTGSLYFFFWLGFFLLLVNPPLTDRVGPQLEVAIAPLVQSPGNPINMGAYLADNVALQAETITFCVHRYEGARPEFESLNETERVSCSTSFQRRDGAAFWNTTFVPTQPGDYVLFAQAQDKNGHASSLAKPFAVKAPFKVTTPAGGTFDEPTDAIIVDPEDGLSREIRAVQFSLDGSPWQEFQSDERGNDCGKGLWTTNPTYKGWTAGSHQLRVQAEAQPQWVGNNSAFMVKGGVIVDPAGPYNITVSAGGTIGERDVEKCPERGFRPQGRTPGPTIPLLLVVVVGVALVARRSRHAGP